MAYIAWKIAAERWQTICADLRARISLRILGVDLRFSSNRRRP